MPSSDPTARIEAFKKKDKSNSQCAVCGGYVTTVLMQHHSFVCTRCAGFLRDVGLTVKGITMTNWTAADADKILAGGNRREKEDLCGSWNGTDLAVTRDSNDETVRRFIQAKYVDKRWARAGGGGGGGSSASAAGASAGGGGSGGQAGPEAVKRFAGMFPDLNEAKAKELVAQHGSVEAAIDAYLSSQASEPSHRTEKPQAERQVKSKSSSSSKRSKSKKAAKEQPSPAAFSTAPPAVQTAPPPRLGEASPSRVQEMAGMVGMIARREIEMPFQNGQLAGPPGGAFGQPSGQPSAAAPPGPFGTCPGPFGAGQQAAPQHGGPPGGMATYSSMPGGLQGFGAEPHAGGWQQHPPAPSAWGQPPPTSHQQLPAPPSPRNPFGGPPPGAPGVQLLGPAQQQQEQQQRLQQLEQRKQQLLLDLQRRKEMLMQQMQQQQQQQQQQMQQMQPFGTMGGAGAAWGQAPAAGPSPLGFGAPQGFGAPAAGAGPPGQGARNPFW